MDARLVNAQIGVETAVRIGRRWQVRVREGSPDLGGLPVPTGHTYLPLARLHRQAGAAVIRDFMILDLRRPGLTMAQNLKAPIRLQRGLDLLTPERFGQMLRALRTTLFARLRGDQLPFQTAGPQAQRRETLLLMGLQELMHLARLGEGQALGRAVDNADALRLMGDLYTAQDAWVDLLADLGNEGGIAQAFIDGYRDRLDGNATALIGGLRPALDRNDLLDAVQAQETLNLWLTAPVETLPEGSVDAVYQAVIPFENLQAGASYAFSYRVAANFTSPQATEAFNVQVTLPVAFGTAAVDQPVLDFAPPLAETTVTVTVVPSGITPGATLEVTAVSVRNATLRSTQPGIALALGATPPVAAFFFYAGPALNIQGRLEIPQVHLTRPQGRNILFRLQNASAGENRTYHVTRQILPAVADTTGWAPLAATPVPDITLAPGAQTDVLLRVDGPKAPAPAPPAGTTGTIVASAVLTAINGSPPAGTQTPVVVTIPFIVV
jgi:hypothetical protein